MKKKLTALAGGSVVSAWALKELYDSLLQAIRDNNDSINVLIQLHMK